MNVASVLTLTFTTTWLMQFGGVAALCSSNITSHPCLPPWLAFKGHCYLWVDGSMSWMDAKRHCQMLSDPLKMSNLVSIHRSDEEEFISEYVQKASGLWKAPDHWIGYNDFEREGNFQWTDGSDVSYEGWNPREPNGDKRENCVERRSEYAGMWNDRPCSDEIQFVCKM